MGFDQILGQASAVAALRQALASGRVHHAYRFEGPDGVGKELCAFALAEALICPDAPADRDCPCRHRIRTLTADEPHVPLHPDLILVGRGLYGSLLGSSESNGIGIEQVRRVVLSRAPFAPHEGRSQVFIVRDADELTIGAANALLKTLEEPPQQTYFVLLTSRPRRLLDTVLSRTLPVRFGPLPDAVVAQILQAHGLDPSVAPLAQGSASHALELADTEAHEAREAFFTRLEQATRAPTLAAAIGLVDKAPDRHGLREQLGHFAQKLAGAARQQIAVDPSAAERQARRHQAVLVAMTQLERNVQPALVIEAMVARLRRA